MLGSHLIRSYSKTQSVIAKSSGESELYAAVRASAEGLGMITLLGDFGCKNAKVRVGMDASAAIGMAQRTGLNKVRHVEVDVLWIQEQVARRMLPITKIPGPRNPSDLCTKNVSVALMEQYMEQLCTRFADGRAQVAQKLHALRRQDLTCAHPSVGDELVGKVGGQVIGQVSASPGDGVLLPGVNGGLGPSHNAGGVRDREIKLDGVKTKEKSRSAEERCVDSWISSGKGGEWTRAHRTPRRAMFTPHRVAEGPDKQILLNKIRVTDGTYVGTGQPFQIIDDYTVPSSAHKMLRYGWIGTTKFREVDQQINVELEESSPSA